QRLKANQYPAYQGGEHGQIIGDVVDLKFEGRSVRGTLFTVAGHPDDCVTVHVGYGRTRAGRVGNGAGFNPNAIRTPSAWSFAAARCTGSASIRTTAGRWRIRKPISSPFRACSARTRRARWSARSARPHTATKG